MNIIIFGSAVTGCYVYGMKEPRDIDVLTDNKEKAKDIIEEWSLRKFGKILKFDFHEIKKNEQREIFVPVLNKDNIGYEVLASDSTIIPKVRENGFASILRLYGNDTKKFVKKCKKGQCLSLLPPEYSYYTTIQNMDKYYSGLLAFRNAAKHVPNFKKLAKKTNCENLLIRLLDEDPENWKCSSDIEGNGFSWNHAYNIYVSTEKNHPVLQDGKMKLNEKQSIDFLFR